MAEAEVVVVQGAVVVETSQMARGRVKSNNLEAPTSTIEDGIASMDHQRPICPKIPTHLNVEATPHGYCSDRMATTLFNRMINQYHPIFDTKGLFHLGR